MADISIKVKADTSDAEKSLDKFGDKAKNTSDGIGSSFGALKGVIAGAVAFLAAGEIISFIEAGASAAINQQNALRGLEQQLALTGGASQGALDTFVEFANVMEATTGIGDDVILNQLALAKSFGVSNEQAAKMVQAATELSAVTGKSLDVSVRTLGKSLSGTLGPLDDSVDAMKSLTAAQLANGGAIDIIIDRYGGSAAAQMDTFSGAVLRTKNAFGNFQESIGEVLVNSPVLTAAIGEIAAMIGELETFVKDIQSTMDGWITTGIIAASVALSGLIDVLQFVSTGVAGIGVVIQLLQTIWAKGFGAMIGWGLKLLEFVGLIDEGAKKAFDGFTESVQDTTEEFTNGVFSMVSKGDTLKKGIENATNRIIAAEGKQSASIKNLASDRSGASKRGVRDAKELERAMDEASKIEGEIRKTNESAIDAEKRKRNELVARIIKNVADGGMSEQRGSDLRVEIAVKTAKRIAEIEEEITAKAVEEAKKRAEEQRAVIADAAANPIEFIFKPGKLDKKTKTAVGLGITSSILEGAAGAQKLLSAGAGAIGDAFLPGSGAAVSSIFDALAKGPEETEAMVRGFVDAIPTIITAVAESMPVVVEALIDSLINDGGMVRIAVALVNGMLGLVDSIGVMIGRALGIEAGRMFNSGAIGETITNAMASGFSSLANFITNIPKAFSTGAISIFNGITSGFSAGMAPLLEGIGIAVQTIIDVIKVPFTALESIIAPLGEPFNQFSRAVTRLTGVLSTTPAWIDTLFNGLEEFANFISELLNPNVGGKGGFLGTGIGAATGITEVPPGFPNDTFPARLTSGERVVPAKTNQDLIEFLDSGGDDGKLNQIAALLTQIAVGMGTLGGGGGLTEVSLKIDGRTLAKELVNIDRRNLRTTA